MRVTESLMMVTALGLSAAAAPAGIAEDIQRLTGGKRVRAVWYRDTSGAMNDLEGNKGQCKLMGFDTATGREREILGPGKYNAPRLTYDGRRIVYTDEGSSRVYVVNWDGTGLKEIARNAHHLCTWYDGKAGRHYAIYKKGAGGWNDAPIWRQNLDDPADDVKLWHQAGRETKPRGARVSQDGTVLGVLSKWPTVMRVDLTSDGSWTQDGEGCQVSMTPDNSYGIGHFIKGKDHLTYRIEWPDARYTDVDFRTGSGGPASGGAKVETWHVNFATAAPFFTVSGPYPNGKRSQGGPGIEIYLGKMDTRSGTVTGWAKVTSNNLPDFGGDAWIETASAQQPPQARISVSTTNVAIGEPVTFDGSGSTAGSGAIVAYAWDFKDGAAEAGQMATHAYDAAGSYPVTLTVTGEKGLTHQAAVTVVVVAPDKTPPPITPVSLVVEGSVDDAAVGAVTLDGQSLPVASGTFLGSARLLSGTYTFTVVATDPGGNMATRTLEVVLGAAGAANRPPVVAAGADQTIPWDAPAFLEGAATDDGLPTGGLTVRWSVVSGPGTVTFDDARQNFTQARFSAAGAYVLRLIADDGVLQASDEVAIIVDEPPSITVLRPTGGQVWDVGMTQSIQWTTTGIAAVSIYYSTDGGKTWKAVVVGVGDRDSGWENYPWVVPDEPSSEARIRVEGYFGEAADESATFALRATSP